MSQVLIKYAMLPHGELVQLMIAPSKVGVLVNSDDTEDHPDWWWRKEELEPRLRDRFQPRRGRKATTGQ
jgi:hypothetical protein